MDHLYEVVGLEPNTARGFVHSAIISLSQANKLTHVVIFV